MIEKFKKLPPKNIRKVTEVVLPIEIVYTQT